jgi:hypothetical protein
VTISFTVDVHHHILPDIFWRATNDAHSPVGGIVPAATAAQVANLRKTTDPTSDQVIILKMR